MAAFSNYLEDALSDLLFRATAFTAPATYVALFTSDPTDAATGTEVSGGSYARKQVNTDGVTSPFWKANVNGLTENSGAITFATATASWGTVTHFAIFDASTAGNMLFHGALTESKTVGNGDTFEFADSALDITLA